MGIFDKFIDYTFHPIDTATDVFKKATGQPSDKEVKQQKQLLNDQISAYKEQTELSKQELNAAKDSQAAEQRRIQEKQIRAVRRNSSMRGFLGSSGGSELDNKLGA